MLTFFQRNAMAVVANAIAEQMGTPQQGIARYKGEAWVLSDHYERLSIFKVYSLSWNKIHLIEVDNKLEFKSEEGNISRLRSFDQDSAWLEIKTPHKQLIECTDAKGNFFYAERRDRERIRITENGHESNLIVKWYL